MVEYVNEKTGATVSRAEANDVTIPYKGKNLILETDVDGFITYANRRFVETSGYSKEDLIGLQHCIHMHPEMPQSIFKDACQMTSAGKTWNGYIRNIAKNGSSYWTEVSIQPKFSSENTIIGFMAIRREADAAELSNVMEEYARLLSSGEDTGKSQYCGEVYMGRGGACNF
jgi:aerotaxis receptor